MRLSVDQCGSDFALICLLLELLKTYNGSVFGGKMLDKWAYERRIRIDITPTGNASVESFNGRNV